MLQKDPLLLEGLLQSHISGLRVLARHPHQRLDTLLPVLYLLSQPLRLWTGLTYVTPQIAPSCDYGLPSPPEEALGPRKVWIGDDQKTIGPLQEVTPK